MKLKMNLKNNFKLVPEGKRLLKITKSECTPSGNPNKWSLTFEDSEGGFINSRFDFTNDKSRFAMGKFLETVLGFEDGDEFDTTTDAKKCLDIEIYADVKHTVGNKINEDGEPTIFANIVNQSIKLANEKPSENELSPRNSISTQENDDLD